VIVFDALGIQHTVALESYRHLWPVRFCNVFSTLSNKLHDFCKKSYWTWNVCFNFLYIFLHLSF